MIQTASLPSSEELHALFHYDPETGALTWKERPPTTRANKVHNVRDAGKEVGATDSWGHRQVRVGGRLRAVHRVIWKMMTGEDPKEQIDHVNGVYDDNRWVNLREASQFQNAWNRATNKASETGLKCIHPLRTKRASSKKWRVKMRVDGRQKLVGDYVHLEEAIAARDAFLLTCRDPEFIRR